MTIQFAFKAPMFIGEMGVRGAGLAYLEAFIEPFGTLWFIYLLPIFFVVVKLTRSLPWLAIWLAGAALEIAHVDTGWTVIDEFAHRFVYFYSGYVFARTSSRWRPACSTSRCMRWALSRYGPSSMACWCWAATPTSRLSRWRWASPAPGRWSWSRR